MREQSGMPDRKSKDTSRSRYGGLTRREYMSPEEIVRRAERQAERLREANRRHKETRAEWVRKRKEAARRERLWRIANAPT